jgi:drug/metabolite transporter (DMT)-like permease
VALLMASPLLSEPGIISVTPTVIASLAYQGLVVAFASYLAWFWLLTRYLATPLAVFGFLAPMFGVIAGVVVLSEPMSITFIGALTLVGTGIYLVNSR